MAVYTQVSNEALDAFLSHYDVGRALSFKGIAEGVENSNFLLNTEKATFILTLYEKRVHEEDLPFFLGLMAHMAEREVTCPLPIAARDGELFRTLNGKPAALISFLEGVSVTHPTTDQCHALGACLARFHLASEGFPLRRENGLGLKDWRPLFEKSKSETEKVQAGLCDLIENELDFLATSWPSDLPTGIVHADLFPDNVFFLDNKLSGIIDFYFACVDFFAYDVGICINAWCFDDENRFAKEKCSALLAGYVAERRLNRKEAAALAFLCRGSALRFLLTRLYDWIFHPDGALVEPKSPEDFVARLEFHRQAGDLISKLIAE